MDLVLYASRARTFASSILHGLFTVSVFTRHPSLPTKGSRATTERDIRHVRVRPFEGRLDRGCRVETCARPGPADPAVRTSSNMSTRHAHNEHNTTAAVPQTPGAVRLDTGR